MTGGQLTGVEARRAAERLRAATQRGLAPEALFARLAADLRRVVPFEAGGWFTTDPDTALFTGGIVHGRLTTRASEVFFRNEFAEPDVHKFADLARRRSPVAILPRRGLADAPASTRGRTIYPAWELGSELRVAFALDGSLWGVACLSRDAGDADFTPAEARFVAGLAPHVALALRTSLLPAATVAQGAGSPAPGLLVVRAGDVESASPSAEEWLERLDGGPAPGAALPQAVVAVVAAALGPGGGTPARARVRAADGTWLTLHAAPLSGSVGEPRIGVLIEPARRAAVAPVLAEAYGLTPREREVLALLAQGRAVDEIAGQLVVSLHTARDHVKRIQAKVGVRSRAELVARLYADHYEPPS